MLHRVRGHAFRQNGDEDSARAALERSLRVAEEAGADYEAALTLAALGRREEAEPILERLGVVAVPEPPI
jgi:tetratricopeptide (TPR) repeat protein